jgi:hypothetical protein
VNKSRQEWQSGGFTLLENEMPSMEALVDSLSKEQAASNLELIRVESQLVDRRQLVISAMRKLTVL